MPETCIHQVFGIFYLRQFKIIQNKLTVKQFICLTLQLPSSNYVNYTIILSNLQETLIAGG